jgi:hypothetical protein
LHFHPLVLGLATIWFMAQVGDVPIKKPLVPPDQLSPDPRGWRFFQWDMTKQQAGALGAKIFSDRQDEKHFGLADVEILPGKKRFNVELQFFSHIGLSSILVKMKSHSMCAEEEYASLLRDLRKKYGDEKETKNLDYPNAFFLSHVWVVRTTKITLHHSCSKPRSPSSSNKSFLTSIHYEKRLFIELWDQQ